MVLLNQLIINLPISILTVPYNMKLNDNALPYYCLPLQLISIYILEDIIFYTIHRLLHTQFLYKHIHYIHHEWNIPVAMRTLHSHPLEHLFSNVIPVILCGYICRLDWICYNIWTNIALINAIITHSNYNFNNFGIGHDNHHKYRVCYFGTSGLLDYIFNTELCPKPKTNKEIDEQYIIM